MFHQVKSKKDCLFSNKIRVILASIYGLFDNGIYKLSLNNENELDKIKELSNMNKNQFILDNNSLIMRTKHAYLLDHDPIKNCLYFAECTTSIRSILMSCPKTRGIFQINLNKSSTNKEV